MSDFRDELPYSQFINVSCLSRIFSNTSASYKYLFFLSVLDLLQDCNFEKTLFSLEEILLEMLVNAWYPHNYFKLSFGINDKVADVLDSFQIKDMHLNMTNGKKAKEDLRSIISAKDYKNNTLLNMVPFRLLSPFFSKELSAVKGIESNIRKYNTTVMTLSSSQFNTTRPFYMFSKDGQNLIVNHYWLLYFYENLPIVRTFAAWNWLEYMQRRNPSVPNLQQKLFAPNSRSSLAMQTKYWKRVLEYTDLQCIFSKSSMALNTLSLDHFLPWSFVAHDQLWNLIPVSKSINSSKSNKLPSFDTYFKDFANLQYSGLATYSQHSSKQEWEKIADIYISDLKLMIKKDKLPNFTEFSSALRKTMEPLKDLAASQGFYSNWVYNATEQAS